MRINTDFSADSNEESNVFKSLKNVPDLPEPMLEIVSANAAELAKSLEQSSLSVVEQLKKEGQEQDDLGVVLMPFIMELSFIKIQLAALIDQVADIQNGDSD
jgi:hypothetical protein